MTKQDNSQDDVKIKQINPPKGLSDLEKTAILQFEKEKKEELGKTKEFKMINRNRKINSKINKQRSVSSDIELPVLKHTNTMFEDEFELPKRKLTLHETIVIKIDGIRREAVRKNKKDLYHTAIIKLDDIIKHRSALKKKLDAKVDTVEEIKRYNRRFHLFKPRDISRIKNIKLSVDSEEFGRQLYNLNKLALNNLTLLRPKKIKTRKYSTVNKLARVDNIKIKKSDYLKYQDKLNKFAINKLYYKLAPKESKKYRFYKAGVILSSLAFFVSLGFIINWGIQGILTNKLSKELESKVEIIDIIDGGDIVTVEDPLDDEVPSKAEVKEDLYWKYLNTPLSSVDLTQLVQENSDTVGWIIVKNTNINYPVVQTNNNDYYLTHSFTKQYNSAGWIYADFRDRFDDFNKNMVIYGHGRYDKVMFGSLTNALKKEWYTDPNNQLIQLSTVNYNTMWQIFSIYKIPSESYYINTEFGSEESYAAFLNEMKRRSIYDFGVSLTTRDKILTLSTCYNDNGIRLVVQAKLVKIQAK